MRRVSGSHLSTIRLFHRVLLERRPGDLDGVLQHILLVCVANVKGVEDQREIRHIEQCPRREEILQQLLPAVTEEPQDFEHELSQLKAHQAQEKALDECVSEPDAPRLEVHPIDLDRVGSRVCAVEVASLVEIQVEFAEGENAEIPCPKFPVSWMGLSGAR